MTLTLSPVLLIYVGVTAVALGAFGSVLSKSRRERVGIGCLMYAFAYGGPAALGLAGLPEAVVASGVLTITMLLFDGWLRSREADEPDVQPIDRDFEDLDPETHLRLLDALEAEGFGQGRPS